MAEFKPTSRQAFVLQKMALAGMVLRRKLNARTLRRSRSYYLFHPGTETALPYDRGLNCGEVVRLVAAGKLAPFDLEGQPLWSITPHTARTVEFRYVPPPEAGAHRRLTERLNAEARA